jgi:hypothetical protein
MDWVFIGIIYCEISLLYLCLTGGGECHHYFNPIVNYEEWRRLNIFGVLVFTLLLNLLFAPFALIYWTIKVLAFIFTFGRR